MGLLGSGNSSPKRKGEKGNKISFNNLMDVVLIPSRTEYSFLASDLWWEKGDYSIFQQSAFSEIRLYATLYSLEFKKARNKLYQPSAESNKEDSVELGSYRNESICESEGTTTSIDTNNSYEIEAASEIGNEDEDKETHECLHFCVRMPKQSFSFSPLKDRSQSSLFYHLNLSLALLTIPLGLYLINSVL